MRELGVITDDEEARPYEQEAEEQEEAGGSAHLLHETSGSLAWANGSTEAFGRTRACRIVIALSMVAVAVFAAGGLAALLGSERPAAYHGTAPLQVKQATGAQSAQCQQMGAMPSMWTYNDYSTGTHVKVMTYNLFWWNLYGQRQGNGDSASMLIQSASQSEPYGVMGFQECEDPFRVLSAAGMASDYDIMQDGGRGLCIAVRRDWWTVIARGVSPVADDDQFGPRNAQWVRLQHNSLSKTMFFVNHHGPLPLNSGGVCGGYSTAQRILQVVATNAQTSDAVVVVGDFNAGGNSQTVAVLGQQLRRVYNGNFLGGIDNIFTNVPPGSVTARENLGSGGSDHDAISVTLHLGGPEPWNFFSGIWNVLTAPARAISSVMSNMRSGFAQPPALGTF